jgi:hypothetical protein
MTLSRAGLRVREWVWCLVHTLNPLLGLVALSSPPGNVPLFMGYRVQTATQSPHDGVYTALDRAQRAATACQWEVVTFFSRITQI